MKAFKLVIFAALLVSTVTARHPLHRHFKHKLPFAPKSSAYVAVGFGLPFGSECGVRLYGHRWLCPHYHVVAIRDNESEDGHPEDEKQAVETDEVIRQIEKLNELKEKGHLTEEEFEEAKKELLARL